MLKNTVEFSPKQINQPETNSGYSFIWSCLDLDDRNFQYNTAGMFKNGV